MHSSSPTFVDFALDACCELGEGPVWSIEEQSLYFVDITRKAVHRWSPTSGELTTWQVSSEVGCLALCEKENTAVLAMANGILFLDLVSGEQSLFVAIEADRPGNCFNDGKCDRLGRFWAGTKDRVELRPEGALWLVHPDQRVEPKITRLICSNGLGWSPDGRTMYHTDSWTYRIMAYDFDEQSATLSNPRVFAVDPGGQWVPDGLTVDAEGFVWAAKWDGWRVVRYAPNGHIDQVIEMPVQRPTSCAFGGADLDVLYVTSARVGLSEKQLHQGPLAGSIFALHTGTRGLPQPRFAV